MKRLHKINRLATKTYTRATDSDVFRKDNPDERTASQWLRDQENKKYNGTVRKAN